MLEPCEPLDNWKHPPQLLLHGHRRRPGTGGLAPYVEDRGPLLGQRCAVLDRGFGLEEQPAIRERVGRDVDDAHDDGLAHTGSIAARGGAYVGLR